MPAPSRAVQQPVAAVQGLSWSAMLRQPGLGALLLGCALPAKLLLAALCFLVLLPGCSLGEKVDREPVQTLECTRPASLSGLYPAGGSVVLISWADYESGRTTVQQIGRAHV